jgi:ATP-dependent DNA helicase RecG
MTKDELIERLARYEWRDVEFKEARRAVPRNAYESVSAFANTEGGWLVFGVRDHGGSFEIVGVLEVDRVQNDFLSTIRSGKLNRVPAVAEEAIEHDGSTLLVFHVPESPRQEKPVYLDGDIRRTFIRRGATDQRCTPEEIERFLRDASGERYDGQAIADLDAEAFYDPDSVGWYRRAFNERSPGRHETLSDVEFLNEWGFIIERGDDLIPTRAGVLLFGQRRYVRQVLPRPVVDLQFVNLDFAAWSPERRWADRVVVEENLIQAWLTLLERYSRHAERPFGVDAATLRRDDDPPDYISFREAAINLLIHQDYADHGRTPTIQFFRDRTRFWNPGDAFASTDELLDPTAKEVRNPAIVAGFRRIGLSEQAGTGVRAIFASWQRLGHVPPTIENDKERKAFGLRLLKEALLTEEQRLFQAQLGVRLDDVQARLFAYAWRQGQLFITDARAVTGLSGPAARGVVEALVVQRLLDPLEDGGPWELAEHLQDREPAGAQGAVHAGELVTDQGGAARPDLVTDQGDAPQPDLGSDQVLRSLTGHQETILNAVEVPRSLAELLELAGVTHRTFFRRKHLQPLLDAGLVRMTDPDNPQAPDQKYVLTEAGVGLRASRLTGDEGDADGQA